MLTRRLSLEFWVILCLATLPCVLAVVQLGRVQSDEIFQYLEPAFWRVHGYGMLAWEWHDGLRNWAAPIMLSWMLRLCDLVGITNPYAYRAVMELPVWLLQVAMLMAVYRFALARLNKKDALLALVAVGTWGCWILYGGRTLGESLSTAFLVIAMEALSRPDTEKNGGGLLGGLSLGLAVVMRYGSIVIVLAVLVWLVWQRRWRILTATIIGGLAIAIALALLDWFTWGSPLHSLIAYTQFNIFPGLGARTMGTAPAWFYAEYFFGFLPGWVWVGLPMAIWKLRLRVGLPVWCATVYFASLLATPHKEPRFLMPGLMLLVLAGAPGLAGAIRRWVPGINFRAAWAVALLAGVVTYGLHIDLKDDEIRAVVAATRPSQVHGIALVGEAKWNTLAYFFVGKPIALHAIKLNNNDELKSVLASPQFDRVVVARGRWGEDKLPAAGFHPIGKVERFDIWGR